MDDVVEHKTETTVVETTTLPDPPKVEVVGPPPGVLEEIQRELDRQSQVLDALCLNQRMLWEAEMTEPGGNPNPSPPAAPTSPPSTTPAASAPATSPAPAPASPPGPPAPVSPPPPPAAPVAAEPAATPVAREKKPEAVAEPKPGKKTKRSPLVGFLLGRSRE